MGAGRVGGMGKIMDVGRRGNDGEGDSGYGQKMEAKLETDEKLALPPCQLE